MDLNEQEVLMIRSVMQESITEEAKYNAYMENVKDPYLKEFYQKVANQAVQNRQLLLQFLR